MVAGNLVIPGFTDLNKGAGEHLSPGKPFPL